MYYKIIKDGCIIDICNSYGKVSRRGLIIECKYEEAQYMLGRLPNKEAYRVEWLMPLPLNVQDIENFECIQITQQEYFELLEAFETEEEIVYKEEFVFEEEMTEEEEVPSEIPLELLTYSKLAIKVKELTVAYNTLLEQNRLLEDCILEMSQKLYQ